MDEFLILHCNRNYYTSWLNEDLIRIIYLYYPNSAQPKEGYPDISVDFEKLRELLERGYGDEDECKLEWMDDNFLYFNIYWKSEIPRYYRDNNPDIEYYHNDYFSVNRKNISDFMIFRVMKAEELLKMICYKYNSNG